MNCATPMDSWELRKSSSS